VNYYRIRISPERANSTDAVLGFRFDGKAETLGLHIRKGVVQFVPDLDVYSQPVDVIVKMDTAVWAEVFNNTADPSVLLDEGKIVIEKGDAANARKLFSLFDPIYDWKNDEALKQLAGRLEAAPQ